MHPGQQKKRRAAQAANHDVMVHLGPPCESPMRRTISHTPSAIRISGKGRTAYSPQQKHQPQGNQHNRADRLFAPPIMRGQKLDRLPGYGPAADSVAAAGLQPEAQCLRPLLHRALPRSGPHRADRIARCRAQIQPVAHLVQSKGIGRRLAVAQRHRPCDRPQRTDRRSRRR